LSHQSSKGWREGIGNLIEGGREIGNLSRFE